MPIALGVLAALGALASIISGLKNIFDDAHDRIVAELDQVLTTLQGLRQQLVRATADILEAIDGIRRQIDEDVALNSIALAERALFSDLAIFNDKEQALGNSFQASDRLLNEPDIVFASSFMYVADIRLAVLKDFDPNYFCSQQFRDEFQRYLDRLNGWIRQLNDLIANSNTVDADLVEDRNSKGLLLGIFWEARYSHNGVVVRTFRGPKNDLSETAHSRVEQQANSARSDGIESDRQQFGVVDMERTATAWEQAFRNTLRVALVTQVLSRASLAIDQNPEGLMVDGRIVPSNLDLRSTLLELLASREFQRRVKRAWESFVKGDERLVQFAYRRLFRQEASTGDVKLLRGVASTYGFAAFMATLLLSKQYEERYGRGLPGGGDPVVDAVNTTSPKKAAA